MKTLHVDLFEFDELPSQDAKNKCIWDYLHDRHRKPWYEDHMPTIYEDFIEERVFKPMLARKFGIPEHCLWHTQFNPDNPSAKFHVLLCLDFFTFKSLCEAVNPAISRYFFQIFDGSSQPIKIDITWNDDNSVGIKIYSEQFPGNKVFKSIRDTIQSIVEEMRPQFEEKIVTHFKEFLANKKYLKETMGEIKVLNRLYLADGRDISRLTVQEIREL